MKFLISAQTYEAAKVLAWDAGLPFELWIFIPLDEPANRWDKLSGFRVDSRHLIGSFTEAEKYRLGC